MRIPGKRIALFLAVPAIIGLAFATAQSDILYQSDGKSSSCASKQASASCASKQASASCASKQASASCASKQASYGCASKQASAGCGAAAQACSVKMVQTEEGLRLYVLGDMAVTREWLKTVGKSLEKDHDLNYEIFEAKDGSYMQINRATNNIMYAKLLQATSQDDLAGCCEVICASAGCPPKA